MADKAILRSNTYLVGAGGPGDVDIHSNDGSINVTKESKSAFNIEVANQASNEWGKITGDIYKQTDLQELVGTKQDKLTQGSGIIISPENVISANIDLSEYAKKSEIPNSYDKSETYTKNEVNNITDGKADKGDSYTKSESDAKYALKGDVPTDVYTKTEADEKFATKGEIPDPYTLPVASETVLGGIKVGNNLSIDEDGTLNANGGLSEVSWGSITGTLNDQTDLKNALDGKQPVGDYALKSEVPDAYTKAVSDARYQEKGNYLTPTDISDMETKTHASATYQPKGNYATASDISDMETKTHAAATYQPKGDYALNGTSYTKNESDAKYQEKGDYALNGSSYTKSESDAKYAEKLDDIPVIAGANVSLEVNDEGKLVISAEGGSQPVDAYTKEESDAKFATKEEIPDVTEYVPKSTSINSGNWNWELTNSTSASVGFNSESIGSGAKLGLNIGTYGPQGFIELDHYNSTDSNKKLFISPEKIEFTKADGTTYGPVLEENYVGTYGTYYKNNELYMWLGYRDPTQGGGNNVKLTINGLEAATTTTADGKRASPVTKLNSMGVTTMISSSGINASFGVAGISFTGNDGVTHSLANKQNALTFATDTQIDALFA